jgi:cytochrome c biogenesis protein
MRTALVLLFLLALAAIPGSLVPQTRVDASAVQAFRNRHRDLSAWYDRLGVFDVYSSVWFSAIYVLLMVSLVGCFIPRLKVYLGAVRARPPKAPRNLSRFAAYRTWTTDRPVEVEAARIRDLLASQRRRVDVVAGGPGDVEVTVNAEKGYLREAGNLLFHLSLLVVLVGVAVTGLFGYRGTVLLVQGKGFTNSNLVFFDEFTPGARFDVDDLAPFNVTVDDFQVEWEESGPGQGTPTSFDADLTVTEMGKEPYGYNLRVNHPLEVDGSQVFLVGHGYAPVVTVRDGDGEVAKSGPVIFLPQDGSFISYGVVTAPDARPTQLAFEGYFFPTASLCDGVPCSLFPDARNPTLSLIGYTGDTGLDSGEPKSVYVLDKDDLTPIETADGRPRGLMLGVGETAELGDAGSVTFDGYQRWVRLQVSHQPAKIVPLVGVVAAIIGLLGSLFIRPRRTWARIREVDGATVVEVAALDRVSGGDPEAHVAELANELRDTDAEPLTDPEDQS